MKTCLEITVPHQYPVKLEQDSSRKFRVTYGKQVNSRLDYGVAAKLFGECVMHALACNGQLNPE